jgi:hypothetical protein
MRYDGRVDRRAADGDQRRGGRRAERLVAVVVGWPPESRLDVAVGTRLVLGVVFLAGASRCCFPVVIYGVGLLSLAAALLLGLLGEPRLDALIRWWSAQPALTIRAWCAVAGLVGALLVSAALPRRVATDEGRGAP